MKNETDYLELEASGPYALWTDLLQRTGGDRRTYQVPTYEGLANICKSIYWKPTFLYVIDAVRIMNPIRYSTMVKNDMVMRKEKDENALRYYVYLENVRYQIIAHIEWNMNRPEYAADRDMRKHIEIARRSLKRPRRSVYFGLSECVAEVKPCAFGSGEGRYDRDGHRELGMMYHSLTHADEAYDDFTKGKLTRNLWSCSVDNGIIRYPAKDKILLRETIGPDSIKNFGPKY